MNFASSLASKLLAKDGVTGSKNLFLSGQVRCLLFENSFWEFHNDWQHRFVLQLSVWGLGHKISGSPPEPSLSD